MLTHHLASSTREQLKVFLFIFNLQILKVINKLYEFYFLNSVHLYYPIEHLIQVQMLIFSLSHTHQVIQSKRLLYILLIQHIETKSLLQMFLSENHSSDHFRLIIEESRNLPLVYLNFIHFQPNQVNRVLSESIRYLYYFRSWLGSMN